MTLHNENQIVSKIFATIEGYEFRSFVIGFARPEGYDRSLHEESFRKLKVSLGKEVTDRFAGVTVDFERPELRIDIDDRFDVHLRAAPLFVAGRYRKLSRSIPSSSWIHHRCEGRGCPSCSHSGVLCGPSVQQLVGDPVLRYTGGTRTFFHALGREDTDALMLDEGRPFVLEVQSPVRRELPLREVQNEVGRSGSAEVLFLTAVERKAVRALKTASADKTYRAWISVAGRLPVDAADRVASLGGMSLEQLSPQRVMHRRGRKTVRSRRIVDSAWLGEVAGRHVWEVRAESGTYIKELVSGDGGRTRPSLSEVLGVPCTCVALDVLEIHWIPPWERPLRPEVKSP